MFSELRRIKEQLDNLINNNISAYSEENEMPRKIILCGKKRTISKRKDGRWTMNFMYKGKRKFIYHTKQEKCIELFKKIYNNRENFTNNTTQEIKTLNEWLNVWYKIYKEPNLAKSSLESIQFARKKYIDKTIGKSKLKTITTIQIQNALNNITGSRTRQIVKNHLSNAFRYAIKNKLIKENPMNGIEVKHKSEHKSILNAKQQNQLLEAITDQTFKTLIELYLKTGIRRNEALQILLTDIDSTRNTIKIRGTKTEKSNREVPTNNEMIEKLKKCANKEGKIFTYSKATINHKFKNLCNKLGFKNVTIHSLRHTYATNCLHAGIPMKLVQYWLGHSSVTLTSDLYTHITDDIIKNETQKLNQLFDNNFDNNFDNTFEKN